MRGNQAKQTGVTPRIMTGEIRLILRVIPCRKSVFSDRLPAQIRVPHSPVIILGVTREDDVRAPK